MGVNIQGSNIILGNPHDLHDPHDVVSVQQCLLDPAMGHLHTVTLMKLQAGNPSDTRSLDPPC